MKKKANSVLKLCANLFKIGCIGFGGGNALIPVIQDELVDKAHTIAQEEYEEDIVVASITPGALPVELSAGAGKRIFGRKGMLAAATAMALPGVLLTICFLIFFTNVSDQLSKHIALLTVGIIAYISSLLMKYVKNTVISAHKESRSFEISTIVISILVFIVTCGKNIHKILGLTSEPIFSISTINVFAIAFFIILYTNGKNNYKRLALSICISILFLLSEGKTNLISNDYLVVSIKVVMIALAAYGFLGSVTKINGAKADLPYREILMDLLTVILGFAFAIMVACIIVPDGVNIICNGFLSSIMSFGGGDAYLTVADGLFVETGYLTSDEFYLQLVPLVNILPGSILCKTLSGVGFLTCLKQTNSTWLSIIMAFACFSCSIFASCGVFSVVGDFYHSLSNLQVFVALKKWIRPIVSGLMLTVISSLIYQGINLGKQVELHYELLLLMIGIFIINELLDKKNVSNIWRIMISLVIAYVTGWIFLLA